MSIGVGVGGRRVVVVVEFEVEGEVDSVMVVLDMREEAPRWGMYVIL